VNATRLRAVLILVLVVAAVTSVVGKKADSVAIGWFSFALFLVAVALYLQWRRAVHASRPSRASRDKVFDPEAKTNDETRARPDQ